MISTLKSSIICLLSLAASTSAFVPLSSHSSSSSSLLKVGLPSCHFLHCNDPIAGVALANCGKILRSCIQFSDFYWCFTATIDKWSVNRVRKAKYPSASLMEATSELELSAPDGTTNTSQTWSMAASRPSKIATSRRKTFLKPASQEPMNCLFLLDSWHWAEPSMRLSLLVFWSRERCVERRYPTEALGWIQCIDLLTFSIFSCFVGWDHIFDESSDCFFQKNYHT